MIIGLVCAVVWLWQRRPRKSATTTASIKAAVEMDRSLWIILGWSLWILLVWWLATHRIDRFWLPVTGLWSALAAWGLWQVRQRSLPLAQTMLLSGLLYAVLICSSPVVTDNRYFVSLEALRDDVGDENHLPRVPLVQTWINQNLPSQETRVLLIGEAGCLNIGLMSFTAHALMPILAKHGWLVLIQRSSAPLYPRQALRMCSSIGRRSSAIAAPVTTALALGLSPATSTNLCAIKSSSLSPGGPIAIAPNCSK